MSDPSLSFEATDIIETSPSDISSKSCVIGGSGAPEAMLTQQTPQEPRFSRGLMRPRLKLPRPQWLRLAPMLTQPTRKVRHPPLAPLTQPPRPTARRRRRREAPSGPTGRRRRRRGAPPHPKAARNAAPSDRPKHAERRRRDRRAGKARAEHDRERTNQQ